MKRGKFGKVAEGLAVKWLGHSGYEVVERNFRTKRGEIDIIARKGKNLYFIEVKARRSTSYGKPEEAVNSAKLTKMRKTAEAFLQRFPEYQDYDLNFSLLAIKYEGDKLNFELLESISI